MTRHGTPQRFPTVRFPAGSGLALAVLLSLGLWMLIGAALIV